VNPGSQLGDYDTWHAQIAELESFLDDNLSTPWHQLLFEHLTDVAGVKVLEIGCGRGSLSHELCRRAARVTAADFSATAVQITRRLLADDPCLDGVYQANAMHLPFPSASFDMLVSCETLEHVPDPQTAVAEYLRVVRPGGHLYITIPSYLNATGLARLYLKARRRPYNSGILTQPIENWMFVSALAHEFRRGGGRVLAVDGVGHYFPLPGRNPVKCRVSALDARILRPILKHFALHTLIVVGR
jgi:ubiquinone/menaquinone biosynthesis C-methylase UbiE